MSNAFTNFLRDVGKGIFEGDGANMRSYEHADRLYVANNYARMPKVGFLYFVSFEINDRAISDIEWLQRNKRDVGVLVKKIDLPKFKIQTETLNQYNRKTVVQSKIGYNPVTIEFHDDNSDITTNLWKNYYNYYYADGIYGVLNQNKNLAAIEQYNDTKYGTKFYQYGLNNYQSEPFFKQIDIYVLHKGHGPQDFTQMTLVNPLVSDWSHDTLNQDENGKVLTNRMTVNYEFVNYKTGKIVKNNSPAGFPSVHYDRTPSPLGVGGSGNVFGPGGAIAGFSEVFGSNGSWATARSPLDFLGAVLQTKQISKNIKDLKSEAVRKEGYLIAGSVVAGALANPGQSGNIYQGRTGVAPPTNGTIDGNTTATSVVLTGRR
jgi:hypothetical protein